jgi:hypothetical protein
MVSSRRQIGFVLRVERTGRSSMARCEAMWSCPWCHPEPDVIETDLLPPGPIVIGQFSFEGVGIVRELAGLLPEDIVASDRTFENETRLY